MIVTKMIMELATGEAADKKLAKSQCMVVGCNKKAERDHRRKRPTRYCSAHRYRAQLQNSPCRYVYRALKSNAKVRGKEFTITFEYFEQWCKETGYLEKRGNKPGYFTVDRKDDTKGYVPGNIQIMEHVQNTKKMRIDRWLFDKYGSGGMTVTRAENYDECYWNNLAEEQGWPKKSTSTDEIAPF